MEQTDQVLSFTPDGTSGVVFTRRRLENGQWYNQSARSATPEELRTKTVIPHGKSAQQTEIVNPAPAEAPAKLSGSHNVHARLSPSSSKCWVNCTAAVAYIGANQHRALKDDRSSYADEGTEAHDWAAKVLTGQIPEADVPGPFKHPVLAYVHHCLSLVPEGVKPLVEQEVQLFYQPDQTGTCDFAVLTPERITALDYKHGEGVLVISYDSTQLAIYVMSLIRMFEDVYGWEPDTPVDMAVFQPRHREGRDQEPWVITLAELETFCKDIGYRAAQAQAGLDRAVAKLGDRIRAHADVSCAEILEAAPGVKFDPSEGDQGSCRWCKARYFCERRAGAAVEPMGEFTADPLELVAAMPDLTKAEVKLPVAERLVARLGGHVADPLSLDFLVAVYRAAPAMKAVLGDVAEYLEALANEGRPAEGTKLVAGREGNRAWTDEEEADKWLKGQKLKQEERYNFKLKSPTQIEAVLGEKLKASTRTANRFASLVSRSPGKPTLALADDKRPAIGALVDAMPKLEDEEEFEL